MIKKIFISLMTSLLLLASTSPAFAASETGQIHPGKQINSKQCDAKGGPIIDVTEKIKNDADSGVAGNTWAFDTINRHIKVWKTDDKTYCAGINDKGSFDAISGQTAPAGTGTIGDVDGSFSGGYRTTSFTGTLKPAPGPNFHKTHGSVGTFDYQCNVNASCPGYVNWVNEYFSSTSGYNLAWWGWTYKAGKHGTWVNAISGNSGNIL